MSRPCFVCKEPSEAQVCENCTPKKRTRAGRIVKVQQTDVINTGHDYSAGDNSPYWQFVRKNNRKLLDLDIYAESVLANPDSLSIDETLPFSKEPRISVGDISRQLSGQQLKVFEMYVQQGLKVPEIAEILGIKNSTVHTHLKRIRQRFA